MLSFIKISAIALGIVAITSAASIPRPELGIRKTGGTNIEGADVFARDGDDTVVADGFKRGQDDILVADAF